MFAITVVITIGFIILLAAREWVAEMFLEAILGRMIEVAFFGLAGYFWRHVVRAIRSVARTAAVATVDALLRLIVRGRVLGPIAVSRFQSWRVDRFPPANLASLRSGLRFRLPRRF